MKFFNWRVIWKWQRLLSIDIVTAVVELVLVLMIVERESRPSKQCYAAPIKPRMLSMYMP